MASIAGTEFTGYGVVEVDCEARTPKLRYLCAGAVKLNKKDSTVAAPPAQAYAELTSRAGADYGREMDAIEGQYFRECRGRR